MNKKNTLLVTGIALGSILYGARKVSEYERKKTPDASEACVEQNQALKHSADKMIAGCCRISDIENAAAAKAKDFFARLTHNIADMKETVNEQSAQNTLSDSAYQKMKEDILALQKTVELWNECMKNQDDKINSCQTTLETLEHASDETTREIQMLKQSLNAFTNMQDESADSLPETVAQMADKIRQMAQELTDMKNAQTALQTKLNAMPRFPQDYSEQLLQKINSLTEPLSEQILVLQNAQHQTTEQLTDMQNTLAAYADKPGNTESTYDAEKADKAIEARIRRQEDALKLLLDNLSELNVPTADAVNQSFSQINDRLNQMENNVKEVTGKIDTMAVQKATERTGSAVNNEPIFTDPEDDFDSQPLNKEGADGSKESAMIMSDGPTTQEPIEFIEDDENDRRELNACLGSDYEALERFIKEKYGQLVYISTEQGKNEQTYKLSFMGTGATNIEIAYLKDPEGGPGKFFSLGPENLSGQQ